MAWGTRLRCIDREDTARQLRALESDNGDFRRGAVGHCHEAKTFGGAGVAINKDLDLVHHTIRLKEVTKVMSVVVNARLPTEIFTAGSLWEMVQTIAKSSEQYAGANDATALCRGNGEECPRSHKRCLVIA